MAGLFPVAGFGDLAGGSIVFPCHLTVLIGSTSGEMEPAAMPGSIVTPHGLPPHSTVVITPIVPTTSVPKPPGNSKKIDKDTKPQQ